MVPLLVSSSPCLYWEIFLCFHLRWVTWPFLVFSSNVMVGYNLVLPLPRLSGGSKTGDPLRLFDVFPTKVLSVPDDDPTEYAEM